MWLEGQDPRIGEEMAVGRISGPLLKSNLVRNGVNLAFETDLLYLDVNNNRVGIKTANPQAELDVNGTIRTTNLNVTTGTAEFGDINISGSTISSDSTFLNLGTLDNIVYNKVALIDDLKLENNTVSTTVSNANLEFRPNGTGSVNVQSNLNVTGNIHATGNISADGDIVLGDADTDSITFNADVNSNIVPDQDNTFQLGTPAKRWKDVYVANFNADAITTTSLTTGGVDLLLKQGNIIYVAENGNDTNDGDHPQDPYASLTKALSVATAGDTIHIFPGTYTEAFPLTVPAGVTVKGHTLRSVIIKPTTATETKDAFKLNGEVTIEDLTVMDFYSGYSRYTVTAGGGSSGSVTVNIGVAPQAHTYVSGGKINNTSFSSEVNVTGATYTHGTGELVVTYSGTVPTSGQDLMLKDLVFSCASGGNHTYPNNGYAFKFATDYSVTSRSPYIRNVSVITKGRTITASDPRGFASGDAGKGAYIDGAYAATGSKEASALFHSVTFITPGVDGLTCTNGVRIEWLNCFTYFANRSIYAYDSTQGKYSDGKTRIRLGGISGTFAAGNTVTFTSTDGSTTVNMTVESVENDVLVVDGRNTSLVDFDSTPQSISNGSGATATSILSNNLKDFGAEIRTIASASVYGNQGLVGDGPGVLVYAIGHNLAYIGTGKETTNDPSGVTQANEIIESNDAKIRFSSVDHKGDFRVGNLFHVEQDTGTVNFSANELNINLTEGATFTDGSNTTFINGSRVDTGNLRLTGNTLSSTSGDLNLDSASNLIVLKDDVDLDGSLNVAGDAFIGGNITLGDASSVNITIVARINSDLIPSTTDTFNLGSDALQWKNLYVNEVDVDDILIDTNFITTTASNADLELRANGTGKILIPSNNLQIDNNLIVNGTSNLGTTNITGTTSVSGAISSTGSFTASGILTANNKLIVTSDAEFEDIKISGNQITTTNSNSNLELRANGSGIVSIPSNNLTVSNNLVANGTITANALDVANINATTFNTDNIQITQNYITTTDSSSDLDLRASGSGAIKLEGLTVNDTTISSATNITFNPGSELLVIDSTGGLRLPIGTTAQRDNSAGSGQLRYNTDLNRFEGYDGSNWFNLAGVEDLDGNTKITAETSPGANDNVITFKIAGSDIATLTDTKFTVPQLQVDNINIDGNVISTSTNTDLQFSANGTGAVKFENFAFSGSTITNTVTDAVTVFQNSGTGYVSFSGTYGIVLPVGNTSARGAVAQGLIRYNTDDERVELYDGSQWLSVAGSAGGITFAEAKDFSIEAALIVG